MAGVLDEIVAAKRAAVSERRAARPLAALEEQLGTEPPGSPRGLARALRRGQTGLILECKRRAPSAGLLRPGCYDPAHIAGLYREVASAISVLTDEPYFGGELAHLQAVSRAVPLPVLCKDFVVEPYQVLEARLHGADGILLMCSVLDQPGLERCLAATRALGMDALVEVRDDEELDRALDAGADLIGINNRCLRTLEVSLETTERLAPRVPPDVTLVSESGILGHGDLRRLRPLVDAFLVGTAMMRHPAPGRAARQLAFGRVKVCGLTREQDARDAWRLGASWGGLILAPESPRAISLAQAEALRGSCPQLRWTGVFVNEPAERVVRAAVELELDAVQLHGEEPSEEVAAIRRRLPGSCEVWKARRVGDGLPPLDRPEETRVLLDTHVPGRRGGTGRSFDWSLLEGLSRRARQRLVLAGGLHAGNIAAADAHDVWALDVSSGVEDLPGIKSRDKLEQLFAALRGKGRSHDQPTTS
jgi:indole-3-glycerol phosphate synthase/phosphoribosylanthranilate isomerase